MNSFGNVIPKTESLGYYTSPTQNEKIKIVVLSILNVLVTTKFTTLQGTSNIKCIHDFFFNYKKTIFLPEPQFS